ncbi:MAG: lamin tail domain-containing protein, partial [Paludibacteraceae bacterium]|nr:lamin tail domain-containing protein [Paludibacteraceae bacterium]
MHKGSFRTANTLMDNTWWGCDLTFDIKEDSEGEIRFYISSSLPSLGEGVGFFLEINLETRLVNFIYENKTTEILVTSNQPIPHATTNLTCKITRNNKDWNIECSANNNKILNSQFSTLNSLQSATSTGFLLIENPNNPYNLRVNSVNCGDKPTESELIMPGDIVITEIMAKPNPSVQLPEVEWIEIYNTTNRTLVLEECKITTPAKTGTFNDYILEPHDYAILCSYNAMIELSAFTTKICIVESMPTLNNDGNLLTLRNKQNHIISFVEYTLDWYDSEPFKAEGGWSLERRDPSNPLSNSTTWVPSIDHRGGTPAEINSTACSMPDELIPCITNFGIENNRTIQVYFNKPMQGEIISLQQKIEITGNKLKSLDWIEPQREILNIYLTEPLDSTNTIDISFYDFTCISGWSMPDTTITLALPYQAQYMDVIFNELMPYVNEGNSKFIELYNNSNFYIDLSRLMLSNRDTDEKLKNPKIFCTTSTILPPQQYAVISPDTSTINCPLGINKQSIYITATLPSMPATEGTLVLTDRSGNVIDEVHYSDSWHHPLLTDLHDISLERIDPMASSQEPKNWHSSASHNTAGWINSQTINHTNIQQDKYFWLENSTFSPDNDGHQDHLIINHNLPSVGYTLTIDAYTRHGAHIYNIANNQLLNPQGYTLWD